MDGQETTVETTPEEKVLDSIVSSVKGNLSGPVEDSTAPEEVNPDTSEKTDEATSARQPDGDETSGKAEADIKAEAQSDNDEKKDKAEEVKDEENTEPEIDPALAELLGEETDATNDDPKELKQRYEESSREAHRLVTERSSMLEALAKANVTLVQTGTDEAGKPLFGLAPTEEYLKSEAKVDADSLWNGLTEEERDLFDTDPKKAFGTVAKKIETELLKSRPPVDAKAEEAVLPQETVDKLWTSFVEAKDKNGNARYPDADKEEVTAIMGKLHASKAPGMDKFRKLMHSDPDVHKLGLSMLYWGASRMLLPKKIAEVHAQKAGSDKDKQNKGETVIPGSSGGASVSAQSQTSRSVEDQTLDSIVGALKK